MVNLLSDLGYVALLTEVTGSTDVDAPVRMFFFLVFFTTIDCDLIGLERLGRELCIFLHSASYVGQTYSPSTLTGSLHARSYWRLMNLLR